MDKILDKLDKLDDRLNDIDKTLIRNTISLEMHIKRTDELEKHVKLLEEQVNPVVKHVDRVNFLISIAKWLGAGTVISMCIALFRVYGGK